MLGKLGMEFIFCMPRLLIVYNKFQQVGIIVFDGSGQTHPKDPK